tara:strand:- start:1070 stop:1648 length:579 start_codon:yes stop_codon:yes gene_type:complete
MWLFWNKGFHATSMDDLVQATKVSRGGIYADFGGKKKVFMACLQHYRDNIVTPAFSRVEAEGADLSAIASFFEYQLSRMAEVGIPGLGCLIGNSLTEITPHDDDIHAAVEAHNIHLKNGFNTALHNQCSAARAQGAGGHLSDEEIEQVALFLVTSAQGLWATSRSTNDVSVLQQYAHMLIELVAAKIKGARI